MVNRHEQDTRLGFPTCEDLRSLQATTAELEAMDDAELLEHDRRCRWRPAPRPPAGRWLGNGSARQASGGSPQRRERTAGARAWSARQPEIGGGDEPRGEVFGAGGFRAAILRTLASKGFTPARRPLHTSSSKQAFGAVMNKVFDQLRSRGVSRADMARELRISRDDLCPHPHGRQTPVDRLNLTDVLRLTLTPAARA